MSARAARIPVATQVKNGHESAALDPNHSHFILVEHAEPADALSALARCNSCNALTPAAREPSTPVLVRSAGAPAGGAVPVAGAALVAPAAPAAARADTASPSRSTGWLGTRWRRRGRTRPAKGTELESRALSAALQRKLELMQLSAPPGVEVQLLELSRHEVEELELGASLRMDSLLHVGGGAGGGGVGGGGVGGGGQDGAWWEQYAGAWGGEIEMRHSIEKRLTEKLRLPCVTLCVQGGLGSFMTILHHVRSAIPVVLVRDSKGCARALADFYHAVVTDVNARSVPREAWVMKLQQLCLQWGHFKVKEVEADELVRLLLPTTAPTPVGAADTTTPSAAVPGAVGAGAAAGAADGGGDGSSSLPSAEDFTRDIRRLVILYEMSGQASLETVILSAVVESCKLRYEKDQQTYEVCARRLARAPPDVPSAQIADDNA